MPGPASRWAAGLVDALLGYWRRTARRAHRLGPAYVSTLVRWAAWGSALAMALLGDAPRLEVGWPYWVLTFVQTAVFTWGYFLWHRPIHGLLRQPVLRLVDGRVLWAALDLALSLGVTAATGGLWSPFHIYALTAVMFPALVFRWRGALIAATAFAAYQILAVWWRGGLAALPAQQIDSFVSVTVNAYLIALFSAYLASLLERLDAERARTARAWRDTRALYAVAQSVLESPPDEPVLCARVVDAVRRHLGLTRFGIYCPDAGEQRLVAGYGLPASLVAAPADCARVPLWVDERDAGYLVGAHRESVLGETATVLGALAGPVALGLRNAALTREKTALAAEGERTRLAREIHDGVAQSLYMLTLNLEACADVAAAGDGVRPRLEQLLGLSRQALWEVRHYIFDLKPLLASATSLAEVLRNPLREFQTITGLPAELHTVGAEQPIGTRARAVVYRVLQEALANTFKHAAAGRVDVELCWKSEALVLTVSDDGRGFDPASVSRGHGLDHFGQRAAEVDGTVVVHSAPGAGTRVQLTVPYATAGTQATGESR